MAAGASEAELAEAFVFAALRAGASVTHGAHLLGARWQSASSLWKRAILDECRK